MTTEQANITDGSPLVVPGHDDRDASFVARGVGAAARWVRTAHSWVLFWTTAL